MRKVPLKVHGNLIETAWTVPEKHMETTVETTPTVHGKYIGLYMDMESTNYTESMSKITARRQHRKYMESTRKFYGNCMETTHAPVFSWFVCFQSVVRLAVLH